MANYNVGDRVRVKNDIKAGFGVPYEMVKMAGATATVVEIANESTGSCFLKFDEDFNSNFIWFENQLEHIEDDDTPTTPTISSNEMNKYDVGNKYDIGDYVRIVDINELKRLVDEDDEAPSGVVDDMFDYASKLARITDIGYDADNYWKYTIDLDNGEWRWNESMFEYRLGNYENNNIANHRFKYVIGYKINKDSVKINKFNGFIENFAPCGKSVFIDENGKTLVLSWELIEYIMPIDD